ncbi:MAG: hypothetical protein GX979_08365 [Firmicutes bacterium]|nr:hypothetical protein [Bacillota bacterium]
MIRQGARHIILLALLTLLVSSSACTLKSPLTAKAPLTVMGTVQSAGMTDVVEARIVIKRGKHVVEEKVPVIDNSFSATLSVPVGEWEVSVLLVDRQGIVLYQSKSEKTQISLGQTSILDLILQPAASKVHVSIDLEHYAFRYVAMRARIHINDHHYEVVREDSSTPLKKTLELVPGSYEFKVELYTESFRIGDRISQGVWEVIHIAENEEVSIDWSPATEILHVSGRVETLIPAPQNVSLTSNQEGVYLTWDPVVHDDIEGYFVFAQSSPLERFELLNSVPVKELSFLHRFEENELQEVHYIVAAVSRSGIVGYYSAPLTWRR